MRRQPYHRKNLAAAIRQHGREVLENQGAAQLSLRQLAKFLDVTPAAIYRHYPDKAALLAQLHQDILADVTDQLAQGILTSPDAQTMLTRFVTNLLTYAKAHPQAIAFALTAPWPVPQSLQTVLALYATQHHLTGVSPQAVAAVWTFLLGVLVQPQQPLTVDWTVSALKKLVAIPTLKASDSSETADNF
ncbi:TetR/AcrR family transcriptional regulator [Levilactobacillus namurensis]|uniref:TetR/AcrR family transcriptional regulator n=1 Tax=Levilactobacillus namurensis TaxID=380393 RepID=UPI001D79ACC0|nr:TetR/AcrR family transcriptional regulator [Levilactobacillus namurensis]HJE44885.1 TetR/AcrR family transcriptional regulator [Levilactobacillus namurensis]